MRTRICVKSYLGVSWWWWNSRRWWVQKWSLNSKIHPVAPSGQSADLFLSFGVKIVDLRGEKGSKWRYLRNLINVFTPAVALSMVQISLVQVPRNFPLYGSSIFGSSTKKFSNWLTLPNLSCNKCFFLSPPHANEGSHGSAINLIIALVGGRNYRTNYNQMHL